jgi:hypothetical protein
MQEGLYFALTVRRSGLGEFFQEIQEFFAFLGVVVNID